MKKTFKLFAACALMGAALVYTGCTKDYAEDIKGLDDRLTAVEKSVSELQSQIKAGAVITDVTSTTNGVKVTLSNGKTFEITNGRDGANGKDGVNGTNGTNGKDGQDGKPGSVVTIGDNGNWWIDGKDTGKSSRGDNGKDANQVYYKPGSNGCWIKVTVTPDGKVTEEQTTESFLPEGTVTAVWENGALTLYGVKNSPFGEPVVIDLAAEISSLAIEADLLLDSRPVIDFVNFLNPLTGSQITAETAKVLYRVNPSGAVANLDKYTWSFIDRSVKTRTTDVNNGVSIEVVGDPIIIRGKNEIEVALKLNGNLPATCTSWDLHFGTALGIGSNEEYQVLGSLAAQTEEDGIIYSDEAYLQETTINTYTIINADKYHGDADEDDQPDEIIEAFDYDYDAATSRADGTFDIKFAHNSSLNIYKYLETMCGVMMGTRNVDIDVLSNYDLENVEYAVEKVKTKFLGTDGVTNQQDFITDVDSEGEIRVNTDFVSGGTRTAIGKTPIFYVTLKIEDVEVAHAYIRVLIDDSAATKPATYTISAPLKAYNYDLLAPGAPEADKVKVEWSQLTKEVLGKLNLKNEEFASLYTTYSVEYYEGDNTQPTATATTGVECGNSVLDQNYNTTTFAWFAANNNINENTKGKVVMTFKRGDSYPVVKVEFPYTVSHEHNWPTFSANYYDAASNTVTVKGRNVGSSWKMYSGIKEHFYGYLAEYEFADNQKALGFKLPNVKNGQPLPLDSTEGTAQTGVELSNSQVEFTNEAEVAADASDIKLTEAVSVEGKIVWITMYEKLANDNVCEKTYKVKFISPFIVEASPVSLENLLSGASTADLKEYITVKENGGAGRVIYEGSDSTPFKTNVANDYGLAAGDFNYVFSLEYPYNEEVEFNGDRERLKVSGSTLTWENNGATLLQDMKAQYKVVMTLPQICTANAKADITIKKN